MFKNWLKINEAAGAFAKTGPREVFGWLSPKGNFYPARPMQHLDAVAQSPELKSLLPSFDERMAELKSREQESEDLIANDEHPEWHGYEMLKDDIEYGVMRNLYSQGCLRVGSVGSTMHFEGTANAIKNLYNKAINLAEEHEMAPKFEPIR